MELDLKNNYNVILLVGGDRLMRSGKAGPYKTARRRR